MFGRPQKFASGVIAAVFGVSALLGVATHSDNHDEIRQLTHRNEMWRVIDGAIPQQVTPELALASDLNRLIGPKDPIATQLPPALQRFQSPSNTTYGGITRNIGIDPFTDSGCRECGPFTQDFKNKLLLIKQGQLSFVLSPIPPIKDGYRLTPFGLSGPLSAVLAIGAFGGVTGIDLYRRRRQAAKVDQAMSSRYGMELEEIKRIDRFVNQHRGDPRIAGLVQQRDELEHSLRQKAEATLKPTKVDHYEQDRAQLEQDLSDIRQARRDAEAELGLTPESPT